MHGALMKGNYISDLRALTINLKCQASDGPSNPEAVPCFVSKVSELIALKRINDAEVSITSA